MSIKEIIFPCTIFSSLTKSNPTGLSVARYQLVATSVGNYALFGGGYASSYSYVVNAYTAGIE